MKSKAKTKKDFDTVKTFREIKDKISKEIKGMNFEQLNAYLESIKSTVEKKQGQYQKTGIFKIKFVISRLISKLDSAFKYTSSLYL